MNPVAVARASAAARVGVGSALVAAPRQLTAAWIGADSGRPGPQALARGLGIRDLVLGAGVLASGGRERQRWLLAALIADAADLVVTLGAGDELPLPGRVLVTLAASGGVFMGVAALSGLRAR